jgi:hypothetical protein
MESDSYMTVVLGIPIPSDSPLFLGTVGIHVLAGFVCAVAGMAAMASRKGKGKHPKYGTIYYWGLTTVFVTATVLATMRWADDWHLFVLGALSYGCASLGRAAMRSRWTGFVRLHITCMGLSYILLLTAFYVDNGKNLPIWKALSPIVYWTVPAAIGLPIIIWALLYHRLVRHPDQVVSD